MADALHLAAERSRQLAAHDYAAASSRDMAGAAGQLPDLVLKFGIDNLPINGPDRFSATSDFMMVVVPVLYLLLRRRGLSRSWQGAAAPAKIKISQDTV